jgi:hypothetical protein
VGDHLLVTAEVCDHPLLEGLDGHDGCRGAPDHALGRRPYGHHRFGLGVQGDDGGLGDDDATTLDGHQRVRRAQVYAMSLANSNTD